MSWWFCAIGPDGRRSKIAHVVKDGKTLCNTHVGQGSRSYPKPEGAGARPCRRCQKKLIAMLASLEPKSIVLKRMTRMSDSFHVVDIDGKLFYFDYQWYTSKLAEDPDTFGVGSLVPQHVLSQYDLREIPGAPVLVMPKGWTPCL